MEEVPMARTTVAARTATKTAASAAKGTAKGMSKKAVPARAPAKAAAAKRTAAPAKAVRAKAAPTPAQVAQKAARAIAPAKTARAKAAGAAAPVRGDVSARPHLVRDSFTMPEQEYAVLGAVKQACLKAGFEVKKSELLRVGVALLGQLDTKSLRAVLDNLPQLKTGRPPAG
jgi:hypothetical protein